MIDTKSDGQTIKDAFCKHVNVQSADMGTKKVRRMLADSSKCSIDRSIAESLVAESLDR